MQLSTEHSKFGMGKNLCPKSKPTLLYVNLSTTEEQPTSRIDHNYVLLTAMGRG